MNTFDLGSLVSDARKAIEAKIKEAIKLPGNGFIDVSFVENCPRIEYWPATYQEQNSDLHVEWAGRKINPNYFDVVKNREWGNAYGYSAAWELLESGELTKQENDNNGMHDTETISEPNMTLTKAIELALETARRNPYA